MSDEPVVTIRVGLDSASKVGAPTSDASAKQTRRILNSCLRPAAAGAMIACGSIDIIVGALAVYFGVYYSGKAVSWTISMPSSFYMTSSSLSRFFVSQ